MTWQTWLLFVITEAVLSMTPGPAVVFVLSQAIRRGAGKSVWGSCGILSANAMYFALSATSLGAVIVASYKLFFLIKWIGAGYLVYLGLSSMFGKTSVVSLAEANGSHAPDRASLATDFSYRRRIPKRCYSSLPSCHNSLTCDTTLLFRF